LNDTRPSGVHARIISTKLQHRVGRNDHQLNEVVSTLSACLGSLIVTKTFIRRCRFPVSMRHRPWHSRN